MNLGLQTSNGHVFIFVSVILVGLFVRFSLRDHLCQNEVIPQGSEDG